MYTYVSTYLADHVASDANKDGGQIPEVDFEKQLLGWIHKTCTYSRTFGSCMCQTQATWHLGGYISAWWSAGSQRDE